MTKKKKRKRIRPKVKTSLLDTPEERWNATIAAWTEAEAKAFDAFMKAQSKAIRAWNKWQDVQSAASRAMKRIERERNETVNQRVGKQVHKVLATVPWAKKGV